MKKVPFEDWQHATSRYLPPGPVLHFHNENVEFTFFEQGEREKETYVIGKVLDIAFDDEEKSRTDFEIMMEIDRTLYCEYGVEVEFYDYILDDILVMAFTECLGMTKNEYLKKMYREAKEEALMDSVVD
ncbi:MAG: hypothetical protein J6M60_04330 [Clostridia bacterium]|nr:hypothetical protein [Clostridia bacterium]